jgi:hypothetical protein
MSLENSWAARFGASELPAQTRPVPALSCGLARTDSRVTAPRWSWLEPARAAIGRAIETPFVPDLGEPARRLWHRVIVPGRPGRAGL